MQCPQCHHANLAEAKYCEECAAPLALTCANCHGPLRPSSKFCPNCAHPVAHPSAASARFASPNTYTPKHLAEKIRTFGGALEGER